MDFQNQIQNEAERILSLFENIRAIRDSNPDVFNYLQRLIVPSYGTKTEMPRRDTMLKRVMIDLVAAQEILELGVKKEAAKKTEIAVPLLTKNHD